LGLEPVSGSGSLHVQQVARTPVERRDVTDSTHESGDRTIFERSSASQGNGQTREPLIARLPDISNLRGTRHFYFAATERAVRWGKFPGERLLSSKAVRQNTGQAMRWQSANGHKRTATITFLCYLGIRYARIVRDRRLVLS